MPTSPLHTYIPTSQSPHVCTSSGDLSVSSDFKSNENVKENFNQEHALKLGSISFDENVLSEQIDRPVILQRSSYGKRRYTFSGSPDKKLLCKKRRRMTSVALPTKFLLGGNIKDPLNLGSLDDSCLQKKLNTFSPVSSPLSSATPRNQIQVMVPPNINDPLNLNSDVRSSSKPRRRRRHRKSRREGDNISKPLLVPLCNIPIFPHQPNILTLSFVGEFENVPDNSKEAVLPSSKNNTDLDDSSTRTPSTNLSVTVDKVICSESNASSELSNIPVEAVISSCIITPSSSYPQQGASSERSLFSSHNSTVKVHSSSSSFGKIVSPVVPQGSPIKLLRQISSHSASKDPEENSFSKRKHSRVRRRQELDAVKFRANADKFCYGNHKTNSSNWNFEDSFFGDQRLRFLNKDLFTHKSVLDIGCNTGHITLFIARYYNPHKIVGVDIDKKLINIALKQVRQDICKTIPRMDNFPESFSAAYGPLSKLAIASKKSSNVYPNNVSFFEANFVPTSEDDLETQKEEYDTILCLRVTKWIHLNFGDDGIKMAFKRMFALLRYGGCLILEPQPWFTYSSSKKITPAILKTYDTLQLQPESFCDYLLSAEVGFISCQMIGSTFNYAKNYRQPIYLLTKGYRTSHDLEINKFPTAPFHSDEWES